uniref:E2 domain-containing protein n=1 Tax=Plectus sambesii TaxID=2011161 RepID=A0A914XLA2_9BILA
TVDSKAMVVRSFAVLEPCGLDLFSGVEFVCCPGDAAEQKAHSDEKVVDIDGTDDDEDDDDDDEDDYYDDDDDDDEKAKDEKKDPDEKMEQDPYFRQVDPDNEHQMYKDALHRLERKHREKVAKVMREWSELDNRYKTMKEKDPKHADEFKQDMTARFQKTVAALEEEQKEQKQQINEVHQERVQSALNEHKRVATREFRQALANQVGTPNKHNVLKTLKSYIRAEEKDRTHMLNRYRHLLRTDAKEAEATKDILLRSLRDIDLRINGTFAMLRDFPDLDAQVRPIAMEFWEAYRKENTPEVDDEELMKVGSHDKNVKLIELYKQEFDKLHAAEAKSKEEDESNEEGEERELHVEIEPIVNDPKEPMVAHELPRHGDAPSFVRKEALTHDTSAHEMSAAPRVGSSNAFLFIVGSAAVAFLLVAVVVARRRRPGHAGFIEVDACTPEERHVSGMQVNGYENPTYNFFGRA